MDVPHESPLQANHDRDPPAGLPSSRVPFSLFTPVAFDSDDMVVCDHSRDAPAGLSVPHVSIDLCAPADVAERPMQDHSYDPPAGLPSGVWSLSGRNPLPEDGLYAYADPAPAADHSLDPPAGRPSEPPAQVESVRPVDCTQVSYLCSGSWT
jgi:hypothetical protein